MRNSILFILLSLAVSVKAQFSLPINMGGIPSQFSYSITVDNTLNSNTLTNYPARLNLSSSNFDFSKSNSTGDDIQMFDSDNATALSFYIESFNKAGQTAVIWIKIPSIPASSTKTIYLRYGNLFPSLSNGANTFECFDDFSGISGIASAINASSPIITGIGSGYLGESLVFDNVTNKYWTIFEDRSVATRTIRMASASTPMGTWTVESTPVISDAVSLGSPCLLNDGVFWYIYYQKNLEIWVQKSSSVNTGYSATGISNPVVGKSSVSGAWDENRVLEPFVFKEGSTFYMFYMGESVGTLFERTGYATSSSPISGWVKYANNPVMVNQSPYTWNAGQDQCADPFVFKVGNVFYIGTTGCASGKAQWVIGFYTTTDFITFTPQPNSGNVGLRHGSSWDSNAVLRGSVLEVAGTYYFLYTGFDGSTVYSIGMTTLNLSGLIVSPIWTSTGSATVSSGSVTVNSGNIKHLQTFGQGYAFSNKMQYPSTGTTFAGLRGLNSDYSSFLANSPNGTVKPITHLTLDNIGSSMASSGSSMITEIKRNSSTDVRFSINDGSDVILNTQIPTSVNPPLFNSGTQADWMFVRKYSYPEPTLTVN